MVEKSKLSDLVQRSYAEMRRFGENLGVAGQNTFGVGEVWSGRDVLGHVVEWGRRKVTDFNAIIKGEAPPEYPDDDQANAEIAAEYRQISWEELLRRMDEGLRGNLALIERLSEQELEDPQRYSSLDGRPAWRDILSNAYNHALASHLRPWYNTHGQADYATRLAEEETQRLLDFNDSADWQGVTIYNLGCQYALAGDKHKALEKLREAYRLNPQLRQFSSQDPDLASLRGEPEFEALAEQPSQR